MKMNYVIVDASEFLKENIIDHINKSFIECDEDDDVVRGFGHPLEIQGKMLISDLEGICKENQGDLILWGFCINFYMTGYVQLNLWFANYFTNMIEKSLEEAEICYDTDTNIGDIEIILDSSEEDGEKETDKILNWIKEFPTFIERSKEYKKLINNLTKYQL